MKFIGKILSVLGAMAGIAFLAYRGITKLYESTFHREELYDGEYVLPKSPK